MTQTEWILEHLLKGWSITPLEALQLYGSLRLGARIHDLRSRGIRIEMEIERGSDTRHFARYWMKPEEIERVKRSRAA